MAVRKGVKRKKVLGSSNADAAEEVPASKASKPASPRLAASKAPVQVPDAAEVLEIARTQNLFKSNLFRMQLEELLKEIAPRRSHPKLETFLRALHPILRDLKERDIPENFEVEYPNLFFHQRQPHPFTFKPPKRVDVIGSFLLGTCPRSHPCVDLAIEMPSEAFATKDYLNFRYLDKRAAYVGEVYAQLLDLVDRGNAQLADVQIKLGAFQGDPYRPCVVIQLGAQAEGGAWVIRILPCYAPDLWPQARLGPDRNALRPPGFSEASADSLPPTPHYNCCVLEDSRMRSHLEMLHKSIEKMSSLKEAILLLKRWAVSRGFIGPASGAAVCTPLNGFCLSVLAAHTGQTAGVSPASTSSYQLFKLSLSVFATTEWASQKIVFGKTAPAALSDEEAKVGGAYFYDADGLLNFFSRLKPFVAEICWEAQRTLKLLDTAADPFDAVFGECASPELVWDLVLRTSPLDASARCPELRNNSNASQNGASVEQSLEQSGLLPPRASDEPLAHALGAKLAVVLAKGLGDRCTRVGLRLVADQGGTWDGKSKAKQPGDGGTALFVGLTLEASNLDRAIDRGPAAQETKETARFHALWGGDKAELRRFKDGSILECVVWNKPPAERQVESRKQPAVVTQIVRHLLGRHFKTIADGTDVIAGPIGFVQNLADQGRRLWQTFESCRTHLCQLSSLPLTIKDVHPEGAAFSYSEVDSAIAPVAADGIQRTLHGVVVEFESSGRWPDGPEAQRRVCTALLIQMKEELQTDLGIESGVTEDYLDVRYPEFVFRIRIFHQHELTAVAHRVTNFQAQLNSPPPEPQALDRLCSLWWRPRIRGSMHGHVLQRPAIAGSAKLLKRWLSSQMLSGYDEFAEHIIASVFLQPLPFDTPTSAQAGFCRACWLLSSFDWHREPLVVDFDGKLSDEERLAMRRSFETGRADGVFADRFWICSRFDPHAMLLATPSATASVWLRRRAQQALRVYQQRLLRSGVASASKGWQELFALDTSLFDVVIRLETQKSIGASKVARRRAAAARTAVDTFIEKLQRNLSPICLVFCDRCNNIVALKWRPGAFLPQAQHALMGAVAHSMVSRPGGQPLLVPNILQITSTIAALAQGLAVEVKVAGSGL